MVQVPISPESLPPRCCSSGPVNTAAATVVHDVSGLVVFVFFVDHRDRCADAFAGRGAEPVDLRLLVGSARKRTACSLSGAEGYARRGAAIVFMKWERLWWIMMLLMVVIGKVYCWVVGVQDGHR